jgi:hypothetical protein
MAEVPAVAQEPVPADEPIVADEPMVAAEPVAVPEPDEQALPPLPAGLSATERLLHLIGLVLRTADEQQRRNLETPLRLRFQANPSHDNLLAWTVVRAYITTEPDDLRKIRTDLQVLSASRDGLSDSQRHLAVAVLTMVDGRLRLGDQIASLESQIESLTEIEDSLSKNHNGVDATAEAQ